jgi:hypothetical protein
MLDLHSSRFKYWTRHAGRWPPGHGRGGDVTTRGFPVRPPARRPIDTSRSRTHGRVRASEKIDLLPRVVAVALVRRDAG